MNGRFTRRGVLERTAALGLVAVAGACGPATAPTVGAPTSQPSPVATVETSFQRIKREKVIRIGSANEDPWSYVTKEGKITGLDVEVARAVFATIDVKIEAVITEFAGLLPGLLANRFDMPTGFVVRPARCEQADPSEPWGTNQPLFITKKGNPKGIRGLPDVIRQRDTKIGQVAASASLEYATLAGVPQDQMLIFPDIPQLFAGLQAGRVDVITTSGLTLSSYLKKLNDPNLELVKNHIPPLDKNGKPAVGYLVAFFRKGENDLREFYNQQIAKMRADGTLIRITEPFDFTPEMLPDPAVRVANLCKA